MKQPANDTVFFHLKEADSRRVLRISWMGSLVCFAEWNNLNRYLKKLLGKSFDPKDLVKLTFRGIPDTDSEYNIDAEIALRPGVSLPRQKRVRGQKANKDSPPQAKKTRSNTPLSFTPVPVPHRNAQDQEILERVAALSTAQRLLFYQDVIAKYRR